MLKVKQILITTGDCDGIGQEITIKALKLLKPKREFRFLIYSSSINRWPKKIGAFHLKHFGTQKEVNHLALSQDQIGICSFESTPHHWVKSAASRALNFSGEGCGLVTAPMSKSKQGFGHTEILKNLSGCSKISMGFLGRKFNVCLATAHIPVDQVFKSLNSDTISNSYLAACKLSTLDQSNRVVRVLGLNPHSGERGAISKQDAKIARLLPVNNPTLEVPDAAYINFSQGDTYLAWYHDQGLIPFKLVHGIANGIQVTLGLPFIRTSVDHGTAKDIYGKNVADHRSMLLAMQKAISLVKTNQNTLF